MRRIIIIFLVLVSGIWTARGQDVLKNKIYRVTAFKKGDNSIISISNYLELKPPQQIYIPSAFTPNGDGMNDTFGVKGQGIEDFRLVIFNSWGEIIYESTNPSAQWDGKFKGHPVQDGIYNYQLYAKGYESTPRSGAVTLVR